ncbi:MAG: pyruvate dehydrogenase (acetyl-transferring), homodimeric type [Actinomycetia bacterium]|nr:pyruvate dehydrogenase (acetyl-transferring), homodimeric type [Actinomycetes bacterium]
MDDHPIYIDGFTHQLTDIDPSETLEWLDALDDIIEADGETRARYLMARLVEHAREQSIGVPGSVSTPYINTIPPEAEAEFPGDPYLEKRIRRFIRWNAAAMVIRANKAADGIGGHLSTFASSATLYEIGFNHFFRGKADGTPGDHVYIQGHTTPGIYARAFLEGRLDEEELDRFRREIGEPGLSSYPHPRLMPDFWEYPTVSMGLGPINSIYHAQFLRYLDNRGIEDTSDTRVWCFLGDGETDEPETLGSISLAGREKLDNLTWVVNANLQRLDGPVRGNGKIIQELEAMFRGAGWNVIKVIWGSDWDPLLAKDVDGALVNKMNSTVDGEYQRYKAESGEYIREHFFGPDPKLAELVSDMSDDEIWDLRRGGLDHRKVYAAYKSATELRGAPTVILAKTIKGWTLGANVAGKNATHSIKKLTGAQLRDLRDRLHLHDEISDADLESGEPPYLRFEHDSPEYRYLMDHRDRLNGPLPSRGLPERLPMTLPDHSPFAEFDDGSGTIEVSTTGAFTRLLRSLSRDPNIGERIVPIIPDEGRTFGMEALFKEIGIYAPHGQLYEPVDHNLILSYKESTDGQILEQGITEAGATASWIAAATSYATRGVPMIPFYAYYSMFGFQRVGDALWGASDAGARGFLLGATAGRTTLAGEGLQHQDGHSHILASTIPACEAYDPAFAYEMATIIEAGIRRMYGEGDDVFYYLTLYNEPYTQPAKPEGADVGIITGLYRFADAPDGHDNRATILFSGSAYGSAKQARDELAERYGVAAELWSATSYKKLREDALAVDRWNRLNPAETPRTANVTSLLESSQGPIVAVTDYMRAVPDQIAPFVPRSFATLGTDGYGRSDTREALRSFFEVDADHVVIAVLSAMAREGTMDTSTVTEAIERYGVDPNSAPSWLR